jgi:hypothetical protein
LAGEILQSAAQANLQGAERLVHHQEIGRHGDRRRLIPVA